MKQWYQLYACGLDKTKLQQVVGEIGDCNSDIEDLENNINANGRKPKQVASEIGETKLHQLGAEMDFPTIFSYVLHWRHHVLIVQRSRTIEWPYSTLKRTAVIRQSDS